MSAIYTKINDYLGKLLEEINSDALAFFNQKAREMIKIIFQSDLKTHRWINLFEFTWFLLPKWLFCLHQMWLHANIKLINIFADNIIATILSTNVLASHLKLFEIWNTLENWANRYMSLFTTRHHLWHDKACPLNMIFWAKIEGYVF